jgi:hypothetical protein
MKPQLRPDGVAIPDSAQESPAHQNVTALCRFSEFQAIPVIPAMRLPYIVYSDVIHCVRNQVDRHGRVCLLAPVPPWETGNALKEFCYPFRFVSDDDLGSRPGYADHLLDGLPLAREKIDPTNVENAVEGSSLEWQRLGSRQE